MCIINHPVIDLLRKHPSIPGFQCPAEFWPALGYEGDARFVAIWWEQSGDEACYSDGHQTFIGAGWISYLQLIQFNFPLDEPDLGSSETPAMNHLIIDRLTEWAWLVPAYQSQSILQAQHPALPDNFNQQDFIELFLTSMSSMLDQRQETPMVILDQQIDEMMRREESSLAALKQALQLRPQILSI